MNPSPENFIYSEELYKLPQKTIVLLPVDWEALSEDQVTLLGKILGSVKLSLAGVQVICREKINLRELLVFNPEVIISFGVAIAPDTELYQPEIKENVTIIRSHSLPDLDDSRKKDLWNALKKLSIA